MKEPTLPTRDMFNIILMLRKYTNDKDSTDELVSLREPLAIATQACEIFLADDSVKTIDLIAIDGDTLDEEQWHSWVSNEARPWYIGFQEVYGGKIVRYERFEERDKRECIRLFKDYSKQDMLVTTNAMGATEVVADAS